MIKHRDLCGEKVTFLFKTGLLCWISTLVFTGTYFRIRPKFQNPTLDWLIILQLIVAVLGGMIGIILLYKSTPWGIGSKSVLAYILAAGLSIFWGKQPSVVFGYWILLTGNGLLTLGLVKKTNSLNTLKFIENAWLYTISLILLKDAVTSFFIIRYLYSDTIFRLGTKVTHPVTLSFMAVLAFFISFRDTSRPAIFWWPIRIGYLIIIALARTRMSMLTLVVGGAAWIWYSFGNNNKRLCLKTFIPCSCVTIILAILLAISLEIPIAQKGAKSFNRNHGINNLTTFSNRTDIWQVALKRVFDNPITLIFGHGYGSSRLVLMEDPDLLKNNAANTHNTLLEIMLCMGFLGIISCFLIYSSGFKWIFTFSKYQQVYSSDFALRAAIVILLIFLNSLIESIIAVKINPIQMIFIYYIIALDQKKVLSKSEADISR